MLSLQHASVWFAVTQKTECNLQFSHPRHRFTKTANALCGLMSSFRTLLWPRREFHRRIEDNCCHFGAPLGSDAHIRPSSFQNPLLLSLTRLPHTLKPFVFFTVCKSGS